MDFGWPRYLIQNPKSKVRRVETLKTNGQFERVRRAGRSWASGPVVLNAARNGGEGIRCGFVVGKKVGGAVGRNRARRLIREALRQRLPLLKPGYDLVWVARSSISEADFGSVQAAIDDLLRRGKLLRPPESVTDPTQSRIMLEDESPGAGEHNTHLGPAESGSNPLQK